MPMPTEEQTRAPEAPPAGGPEGGYRSVADGDLTQEWKLSEFFRSLNTVMRLPEKAPEPKPGEVKDGQRAPFNLDLSKIRIPAPMMVLSFVLVLGVFVVRPLMLNALAGDAELPAETYGVWTTTDGSHAGRMFEVTKISVAFRTSKDDPTYTWHRIDSIRRQPSADSTLYTVTYQTDGKTAEFSFWHVPQSARGPVIRFKNLNEVTWTKTTYEPIARPNE
jgi:hypothetical protein